MKITVLILFLLLPLNALAKVGDYRPYADTSPWNTPIGKNPFIHPQSDVFITQFSQSGYLGSKVTSYTLPLYIVAKGERLVSVFVSNIFSEVSEEGQTLAIKKKHTLRIPLPRRAQAALGTDAQIVIWDPETGAEWGFWQFEGNVRDGWTARNGYCYNTRWSAVPPKGFVSRGAGVPYFTGLIRPWEIQQGRIEHALALGVNLPARSFVYPATKSDGSELFPSMPMGSRLQLDPQLTDADFSKWKLSRTGKIIARAMQEYGLIVIDGSGHPKIYAEYEGTAHWRGVLHDKTITNIPYRYFRVLYPSSTTP